MCKNLKRKNKIKLYYTIPNKNGMVTIAKTTAQYKIKQN